MNPTQTAKKPFINSFETDKRIEQLKNATRDQSLERDNHLAWESYLTTATVEAPRSGMPISIEKPQVVEVVDLVETKTSEVGKTELSITDLENSFYSSEYETSSAPTEIVIEKVENKSIDVLAPLETVGKSAFAAYEILNSGYKKLPVKDVQAAFQNFSKNFWEMFVTGEYFKKKDDKKKDEKKPAPAPMVFSMSNAQNTRLEQTSIQINQQIGSGNLAFRGSVNQSTGEVYAYYQAEAERAQTFAQKAAEKRNNSIQMPTGKDKPGIPGMGKMPKKALNWKCHLNVNIHPKVVPSPQPLDNLLIKI